MDVDAGQGLTPSQLQSAVTLWESKLAEYKGAMDF